MRPFAAGPPLEPRSPAADDPAVTVVLPTYRRHDVLTRAMRSVLAQTFEDLELVVVDDEPSEDCRAVVEAIDDPRVRYVAHERNRGLPAARNTGVRHGRGSFIGFIDDDDEWLPTKLEHQLECLGTAGPDVGVVTCFQEVIRAGDETGRRRAVRTDGDVLAELLRNDAVNAQVMLIRRPVLERTGLFVEEQRWLEDYELTLRLAQATRWATWPEIGVRMHRSDESMSTDGLERRVDGWTLVIERHGANAGRRARARWWAKIARLRAQLGDKPGWRTAIAASLRADPLNPTTWAVAIAGTVLGPGYHARLARWRGRRRERLHVTS